MAAQYYYVILSYCYTCTYNILIGHTGMQLPRSNIIVIIFIRFVYSHFDKTINGSYYGQNKINCTDAEEQQQHAVDKYS